MLFIGIIIAIAIFFYFQQKASDRNMKRFQDSREKFDQLLERLRKDNNETNAQDETTGDK